MMKAKSPSVVLACVLAVIPMYGAGYLAPVDHALSHVFDSVLMGANDVSGPLPRELAIRRLVDRTTNLLESEGVDVDREHLMQIARIADRVGLQFQLPPSLILSVIHTESHFDQDAVSPMGAIGLMQIQTDTAREFAEALGLPPPTTFRLFEPETNILLGTGYLRQLIDRFGDVKTALAAYHVGPTEVGRRLTERSPIGDRYGREIREREVFYATPGTQVLLASATIGG
jgi:hypothetical protein